MLWRSGHLPASLTDLGHAHQHDLMARRVVSVAEAKAQLSELIERAAAGEEIVVARAGVPRARLVAIRDDASKRIPGKGGGRFRMNEGFDDPLPEWVFPTE